MPSGVVYFCLLHKYCKFAVHVFIFAVTCSLREASPSSLGTPPCDASQELNFDTSGCEFRPPQRRSHRTPFIRLGLTFYHSNIHDVTPEVSSTLFIFYQNSCIESSYPLYLRLPSSSASSSQHMNHLPLSSE